MQEMAKPPDTAVLLDLGFVVEWQLADDTPTVIDLSMADDEVLLPDDATTESSFGHRA